MAHDNYDDRHYVIFNCTELGTIDFTQVFETSIDTVRKSVNELQTFVKYDGAAPPSVVDLTTKTQEYSHDEILIILAEPAWTDPNPHPTDI
jgi:hypothetical protein|tara:strand:- start:2779 stop:3051 length:273 start_codon:yes stop_codon:yes gene_type:complete